jgi:hypothetical protein
MADASKNHTLNSVHSLVINNINNVSETGFVSVIRCVGGGGIFYSVGFVRSLDHSSTFRNDSMSSVPHTMVNVNTHILAQARVPGIIKANC